MPQSRLQTPWPSTFLGAGLCVAAAASTSGSLSGGLALVEADAGGSAGACTLINKGEVFGKVLQLLLALLGALALLLKRWRELPRRPWGVWALDVSKQAMSMCCAHGAGMINAVLLASITRGGDECSWYLISFTVDTSLGVFLAMCSMRLVALVAHRYGCEDLKRSGDYGELPLRCRSYIIWAKQMAVWCLVTICARAVCGALMYVGSPMLVVLANAIASALWGHPHLFLAIVMLGCPVGMNLIQVWIQDNMLRKSDATDASLNRAHHSTILCCCSCSRQRPTEDSGGVYQVPKDP